MVQRGHVFAIVDEVDSILIDEARTPLIISGPADESAQLYYQFAGIVRTLTRDDDYEVDEEKKTVVPTESGIEKVEKPLGVDNIYDAVSVNYVHQLTQALTAKELYHRDKDYLVAQGEVKIVDEFTGRTLDGRRWSDGLHQAVEAKERVPIKEENHTWATVTLQNYFRLYEKLAGMTGTAETEAGEFASTYELPVVPDPDQQGRWSATTSPTSSSRREEAKFDAVVDDIVERNEPGQPVLVGTASVAKSEHLSRLLEKRGIPHKVLNAKQHFREAEIVAQAGRLRRRDRGHQHGRPRRRHHPGRQPRAAGPARAGGRGHRPRPPRRGAPSSSGDRPSSRRAAGPRARRCASSAGSTCSGSERHESRRIDNQLRGRSGRQGDPGESRFFLSLEDELMRLFATGAMNWVMGRTLPDDVPIEAKMVAKAIERAQNTVEGRNAEIRKDVLKYDEVMNEQRKVIYERRLQIIDGEDLEDAHRGPAGRRGREAGGRVLPDRVPRGMGPQGPGRRGDPVLPDEVRGRGPGRRPATTEQLIESIVDEALELLREALRGHARRRGDDAPDRAGRHAADHRPALAGPPGRDGLPPGRHQPARPWASRTRWWPGSGRASPCSAS